MLMRCDMRECNSKDADNQVDTQTSANARFYVNDEREIEEADFGRRLKPKIVV